MVPRIFSGKKVRSGRVYCSQSIAAKFYGVASLCQEVEDHIEAVGEAFDAARQVARITAGTMGKLEQETRAEASCSGALLSVSIGVNRPKQL